MAKPIQYCKVNNKKNQMLENKFGMWNSKFFLGFVPLVIWEDNTLFKKKKPFILDNFKGIE